MPTYDYKCRHCGSTASVVQSISSYSENPRIPTCGVCPGLPAIPMERYLSVMPGFSGVANALAGDRHYEGMRAPDGTDISSRSKHREYMKRTGLATVDDFQGSWGKAKKEREEFFQAKHQDKELRQTLAEQVTKATAS